MSPPLIGITTYSVDENGSYTLPAEYVDAVRRAAGVPVLIPPGEQELERLVSRLDGLILAGGGDIDPALYGGRQHPSVYMIDAQRDQLETALIQYLLPRQTPVLAICRGVQIVNVALGGTLFEHLPDQFGSSVQHRLPPREPVLHAVHLDEKSALARIMAATEFEAASWHHQALRDVPAEIQIAGYAPDRVIEAIEVPAHPWLFGVQWHPELTAASDPAQQRLFEQLVVAANSSR